MMKISTSSKPVHNTRTLLDYDTISEAITAAEAGDTIVVDSGTYVENVVVDKALTLTGRNTGRGMTVIKGMHVLNVQADDVSVRGFAFTEHYGSCIYASGISNLNVEGCSFNGATGAIYLDGCTNVELAGNTFDDCSEIGISMSYCTDSVVDGNAINDCQESAGLLFRPQHGHYGEEQRDHRQLSRHVDPG